MWMRCLCLWCLFLFVVFDICPLNESGHDLPRGASDHVRIVPPGCMGKERTSFCHMKHQPTELYLGEGRVNKVLEILRSLRP